VFVKGECLLTDSKTAEMAKLTENSFRDVNIAFANELSIICDKLGIDVWELIRLANHHPRVKILNPGPGVGGQCIAVDPWFIVDSTPNEAKLVRTAREIDDFKPDWVLSKILQAVNEASKNHKNGNKPKVVCLCLSFKANIDDLRESPAVEIVEKLGAMKCCEVLIVGPHNEGLQSRFLKMSNVCLSSLDEAIERANIVAVLVDHDEFKAIPLRLLGGMVIVDSKGIFDN
jgi:UDP-N-acetyl-D-mannosaminuronic acid dehydrogenase